MVYIPAVLTFSVLASTVYAAPLHKRIAQVISDSTKQWEQACDTAGGKDQCNTIAVNAFGTLLAAAGSCDQQDAADTMINLAKTLNNDPNMIKFAQIFAQQPRNSPTSQAVPYCQTAPTNAELNGLFQCQFQSADEQTFVGGLKVGSPGTIPFGQSTPLNPAGSCPANPSGPIADGSQLVSITQDPGVGSSSGGSAATAAPVATATAAASSAAPPASTSAANNSSDDPNDCDGGDVDDEASASAPLAASATAAAAPATSSSVDHLKNGRDAQTRNAKEALLTADSSCDPDTQPQACVENAFSQCVGGKFVTSGPCAAPTQCFALPLVNKPGVTYACTTSDDALARIQATGAQGGITGN
ncbi:hypothetical protein PHLCEN_2v8746 [Hermanssonia centrifuga]|uniref:Uncharacterized protein n=1 Tax=Hermanssonia centrifuga TaxID=98765 RepID=A0A2R6NSV9_9APHY|nr:hypothetical protein PHLCEN_2v8746 [Hermanssonia centrifuga]